jgi:hypothetical protein
MVNRMLYEKALKYVTKLDEKWRLGGILTRNYVRRQSMVGYKLFGIFPIIKKRTFLRMDWYYLFGLIPIWRVK